MDCRARSPIVCHGVVWFSSFEILSAENFSLVSGMALDGWDRLLGCLS